MPGVSAVTAITRHCQIERPNSRSYSSAIRCETAFDSTDSRNGRNVASRSGAGWGVFGINVNFVLLNFWGQVVEYSGSSKQRISKHSSGVQTRNMRGSSASYLPLTKFSKTPSATTRFTWVSHPSLHKNGNVV